MRAPADSNSHSGLKAASVKASGLIPSREIFQFTLDKRTALADYGAHLVFVPSGEVLKFPKRSTLTSRRKASMKKTLFVLTMVLALSLFGFAATPKATSYSYTFDGYCDGAAITVTNFDGTGQVGPKGVPQVLIGGIHELVIGCGFFFDGTVLGTVHNLAMNIPPHYGTTGKVFDLADNAADATGFPSPNFSGVQLEFILDPTANQWALYEAFLGDPSQGTYLGNFGTMTPGVVAPKGSGTAKPTSFGRFKAATKK
jgi:hypothetical protein